MLVFVTLNEFDGMAEFIREVKEIRVYPFKGEAVDKDGELLSITGATTGGVMGTVEYLNSKLPVLGSNPDNKELADDLAVMLGSTGTMVRILLDGEHFVCSTGAWSILRLSLLEQCNPEIVLWDKGYVKSFYKKVRAALDPVTE